uniref:Sulfatase domain-containing protein n=1 Tax=Haemonchus placei TaxID=6290 RepID=A0A0N4WAK5_HAEPC
LRCNGTQPELTYLSNDEWLHVNRTAIIATGLSLACFYRCYDRVEGDDLELQYAEWIQINNQTRPGCEFIETYCKKTTFPGKVVYHNNHNQRNVIVIVFDSISHSNFIRNMPKSLEVLTSLYGSHIFDGMSKIGDQSFPNAVAFLAGRDYATEFGDTKGFFDNHPLLLDTYYAEDYPNFNLFYYLAKGFRRKPVHHYFRPFWLNVYGSYLHRRSKFLCYGNHAMHNIQLHYLSQFLRKYKDSPNFALNWLTELGHDYMNQINVADEDFAKFLTDHFGILKDSFLFVLGDHGHRFDSIRRTTIGRIEERFPFFSMHIPEEIQNKFPQMNRTVHENTQVIYLLEKRCKGCSQKELFQDRNCREAGVPDEFCMCHDELALDTNELRVSLLLLVSELILHATVIDQYDKSSSSEARYRLTIEAKPSGALFEALLKSDPALNTSTVYGTVNRVNAYGDQSSCVYEQELRKFCYCI